MRQVLQTAAFRRLLLSQWISNLGDRIAPIALAFAVLDLTGSAKDLGIVLACQTVPAALMMLPAGVIADRVSRRLLLISSDVVRFVSQGIAATLIITDHASVLSLALTQVVYGVAEAFFLPSVQSVVPDVLPGESLQPANALMSIGRNVAMILGPIIGAAAIAASSAGIAVAIDSASFALSGVLLLALPKAAPVESRRGLLREIRGSFLNDLKDGGREVLARRWLRTIIGFFVIYHLAIMPSIYVLGPLISTTDYDSEASYALWLTTFGIGAIVGGLTAVRIRPGHPIRWVACLLMVGAAQPLILGAGVSSIVMAIAFALAGVCVSLGFTIWDAEVQRRIPAEHLARVASFDFFGAISLMPVGYALAGPLADAVGTREALIGIGVFGVLTAGSTLLVSEVRTLRKVA